ESPAREEETATIANQFAEMASMLTFALTVETPAALVRLLACRPHASLLTKSGTFLVFKKKGKWVDAAKHVGLAKIEGEGLNGRAEGHYADCRQAWDAMAQTVASRVLADLITEVQPVLERFRQHKRATASLDFDDLIFAARDLLRDHDRVRLALAGRFAHLLVDEFQDTDPMQMEIFWRLCGEQSDGVAAHDWENFRIRPGALFLVGDPKQAIYRFRGADVNAYLRARDAFTAQDPAGVVSISTNFRSCAQILTYVNERFEAILSNAGQPGFTALDAFHPDRENGPCIAALDIAIANDDGKASAEQRRDGEAEAVAAMCASLIGSEMIIDRKIGGQRLCKPGDIALLAPTGSDLWRYEEALERHGIPVATQAGKGFFRRQEIQDLIALTRVLADRRDMLALGALLRGPLVGLTEEELLDIVWTLPPVTDDLGALPRLNLGIDPQIVAHPLARDVLERLKALSLRANATTPHQLLSQAIDMLRVRPILLERHRGQAERALANVDLYVGLTQAYAVRGLRAFAQAMTTAWTDESRAAEGRPDAQEDSVVLYTMHAAKGLEWPIVVPINTMTVVMPPDSAITDRADDQFYCPVLGVYPVGYEAARDAEKAELERERIRLWYVATTRARELLVIPRLDVAPANTAWLALLDLSLAALPPLDLSHLPAQVGGGTVPAINQQTREAFALEAATITGRHHRLSWLAPSRDESAIGPVMQPQATGNVLSPDDDDLAQDDASLDIQGGRERGLVLHKLLEEVLTGETADDPSALTARATILIAALGQQPVEDPAIGLSAIEIAGCVTRTLILPDIAALRPTLVPEFTVYAATSVEEIEQIATGITDAASFDANGKVQVIIDWKSDVNPTPETIAHYHSQVRNYLEMTGTERGLIVLVTSGTVIPVMLVDGITEPSLLAAIRT
ncbi:MAG: putative ATP-dependent exodeoxyribonuclease, partial [Herbaspirillum sp.]|nr:putative ATP-dependent exodeoxyribonuclease [Herbaspirillum sp.]